MSSPSESERQSKKPPYIEIHEIASERFRDIELEVRSPVPQKLKSWPSEPLSTNYSWEYELGLNVLDIFLCIIPAALIAKAGLCVYAEQYELHAGHYGTKIDAASMLSQKLVEFNRQLTTIFTICFLVIFATLFKRLALWKAQRGATLAELEMLQASVSPTATLRVMFSLRVFSMVSFMLASTWVWYYAGSQAAESEFAIRDYKYKEDWQFALLSPDAASPYEDGSWKEYTQVENTDMTARYHVYSQNTRGVLFEKAVSDIEEDALPLMYRDTDADRETMSLDGWWTPVENRHEWQLASSIGSRYYVNTMGTTEAGYSGRWSSKRMTGKWEYNTSLINVECSDLALTAKKAPVGLLDSMNMSFNMTNATTGPEDERTFDFWQRHNESYAFTAQCNVSQANVENLVACSAASCVIKKMRTRPGFKSPQPRTRLFDDDKNSRAFFDGILFACGRPHDVKDISTFDSDNGLRPLDTAISNHVFDSDDFSANSTHYETQLSYMITKYFNTFIAASKYLKYDHDIDKQELSSVTGEFTLDTSSPDWTVTTVRAAEYRPYYAVSWPWIALDIVSCTILLAAAIAAFWLRKHTEAPDIFGYVSSLTRENPLLEVPGGSALSGMERTRKMKHVRVKLGEIPSKDGFGRIGLTYIEETPHVVHDLAKGKRYR